VGLLFESRSGVAAVTIRAAQAMQPPLLAAASALVCRRRSTPRNSGGSGYASPLAGGGKFVASCAVIGARITVNALAASKATDKISG
jgi:hypothetical protein